MAGVEIVLNRNCLYHTLAVTPKQTKPKGSRFYRVKERRMAEADTESNSKEEKTGSQEKEEVVEDSGIWGWTPDGSLSLLPP